MLRDEGWDGSIGVAIGSVYDYFPSREGLLAGALAKVTEENLETRILQIRERVDNVVLEKPCTYQQLIAAVEQVRARSQRGLAATSPDLQVMRGVFDRGA